ncbi:hypothetical protein [Paenibacillus apiarius]|uniref:Uncharacterized protein n=1 Tax=Paenibacillus apiarius TaxID=46240 RepID=A0ABT4DVG1_9BACL|nr:hypothetical protein [Paenibacillus apiarius]MCY9513294.1 hypothetical protein [Paenibacillus apiarius]MCY9521347.1 hypothetical protein [Paenibacillus apiarius]MCY9555574.1 hypothetical protein [Paenibacillus apiarius]MCY9560710.1 hypothetical protein [Paenibacillus apiarius]MCY9685039.1 hypothetical protein [Paenibacillus apiarius]
MPNTTQERDWQADWEYTERCKHAETLCNWPIPMMHGPIESDAEKLAHWLQEYRKEKELNKSLIAELSNAIGWLVFAGQEEKARQISESARAHIVRFRGEDKQRGD